MLLGLNLPVGHDLFRLLETFYPALHLCSRVVAHLADPASPSQTIGCELPQVLLQIRWDSFSFLILRLRSSTVDDVGELKSRCSIME